MRSRLLSLSESGEFVDEEGNPHNAGETTYISSPENGSFNGTGARDSSVDQPESPASEVYNSNYKSSFFSFPFSHFYVYLENSLCMHFVLEHLSVCCLSVCCLSAVYDIILPS